MACSTTCGRPSVKLVSLPWTNLTEPSLGLGILRAELDRCGIPAQVLHLNLYLLEHLNANSYYAIANLFSLNDFLFSGVLDPTISPRQRRWLRLKTEELLSFGLIHARTWGGIDGVVSELERLRQVTIPAWLSLWADRILADRPTLVGMTCMFDQTIASLALARLIKRRAPQLLIVLGGYAVREPTGTALLRAFPEIDVVCAGEGEPVIVPLAEASCGRAHLADIPGILYRTETGIHRTPPAPRMDLNNVPVPNYDDFFADQRRLLDEYKVEVVLTRLSVENSRGCWWGQKHHCIFCGIHDDDLVYRARDAQRTLAVMDELSARHGFHDFRFSDYILPHQYLDTLIPALIDAGSPYQISSEIKANLSANDVALLAKAGFSELQPGIESFVSATQQRMGKGVNAMQSIHILLLGKRHGMTIHYNLLYGLPDDRCEDLDYMLALLPRLRHLDPPSTCLPVQITRYAPMQVNPERFGIDASSHDPSYNLIFSETFLETTGFDLDDFCYYFERPFENSPHLHRRYIQLEGLVRAWKTALKERAVHLVYHEHDAGMTILDTRESEERSHALDPIESLIYKQLAEPIRIDRLQARFADRITGERFEGIMTTLNDKGLVFIEAEKILALAIPNGRPTTH